MARWLVETPTATNSEKSLGGGVSRDRGTTPLQVAIVFTPVVSHPRDTYSQ